MITTTLYRLMAVVMTPSLPVFKTLHIRQALLDALALWWPTNVILHLKIHNMTKATPTKSIFQSLISNGTSMDIKNRSRAKIGFISHKIPK